MSSVIRGTVEITLITVMTETKATTLSNFRRLENVHKPEW
jgi:hypothetical protein